MQIDAKSIEICSSLSSFVTMVLKNLLKKKKNKTNSEKTQIQRKETPLYNPLYGSLTFHLEL
jgi:hypothetical protein